MESSGRTMSHSAGGAGVVELDAPAWMADGPGPRIGVLLFDRFSLLDPTGPAEILSRLPGASVMMIAERSGPVRTDTGDVALVADQAIADVDELDVLIVPGGSEKAVLAVCDRPAMLDWIRRMHQRSQWTISVCTGSMILGRAGLLVGKRATTYWAGKDYLETLGARYVAERYVRDGKIITSAGVSAGQDVALYLASLMAGQHMAKALQLAVEYDPQPPFDTGSPAKAGPELQELALKLLADSQV